ncbi:MAG: CPBP family intramembrane glutamic endopeptidase [Hyphomonadaceae bacterium]
MRHPLKMAAEALQTLLPRRALLELAIVVGFALGSKYVLDQVIWVYAGPISLITTLVLFSIYLWRRGGSWASLGLRKLPGLKSKLLLLPQTLLAIVAILACGNLAGLAGEQLGLWTYSQAPAGVEARWGNIEGNLPVYLLWLAITWTSAAFAEELFFRSFLITRFRAALAKIPMSEVLAIVFAAAIFGYGHFYYQGIRGLVSTGAIGIALGTLYLLYKQNLWPLILAHGLVDTMVFTALYAGLTGA